MDKGAFWAMGPAQAKAHLQNCKRSCGDWKEETEKWGQGAILEVLEPPLSVSNRDYVSLRVGCLSVQHYSQGWNRLEGVRLLVGG